MSDQAMMQEAIKQALIAQERDEVPIGAIIVHKNRIVAKAYNQVEMLKDPTAHAEMIAITQATNAMSCKWLQECTMYVTIEPCSMCAGALVLARIKRLVFGATDPKAGACGSILNIVQNNQLNHTIEVTRGLFAQDCSRLLNEFFQTKRRQQIAASN